MQTLNVETEDEFAARVVGILNDATLALMISVGHRTGLFDAMAQRPPGSTEEIAQRAGCQERYVLEWLGAMVTGRIVDYDAGAGMYALVDERAGCLTRAAGIDNLAMLMQYIALLGNVEDEVVECFTNGGGVPYSSYPRFQKVMAEESAQIHDAKLVDSIIPLVPGIVERLEAGIDVLDVACGRGHAANLLAQAFPQSHFTGIDLAEEGIERARVESSSLGLTNTRFDVKDAATLDEVSTYGLVTAFDAIHDLADPAKVLAAIRHSLKPDGAFLCVDIAASSELANNLDHPLAPSLYTFSTMHCMTVSLAQGGAGLGTVWGEERAIDMLGEAGFEDVRTHRLDDDIMNNYYVASNAPPPPRRDEKHASPTSYLPLK